MKKTFALFLMGMLSLPGVVRANLIVNGSFENGVYKPVPYNCQCWVDLSTSSTELTGWRVDRGVVNWHTNDPNLGPAQNGTKMIDLNNTAGALPLAVLSQSFTTTVGQSYDLAFYLSGAGLMWPSPRQVRVDVGDVVNRVLSAPASPNNAMVWYLQKLNFTATATTTTLSFSSVNSTGYWGAWIDNVSVVGQPILPVAAPEPGTLGILAAGLVGLGVVGWQRFRARI